MRLNNTTAMNLVHKLVIHTSYLWLAFSLWRKALMSFIFDCTITSSLTCSMHLDNFSVHTDLRWHIPVCQDLGSADSNIFVSVTFTHITLKQLSAEKPIRILELSREHRDHKLFFRGGSQVQRWDTTPNILQLAADNTATRILVSHLIFWNC